MIAKTHSKFISKSWLLFLLIISPFVMAQENELGSLNLGTTVQGNNELPKIIYIIPWATPPGPGQVDPLVPHSANVFERTFTPIERLEHQRRLRYYDDDLLPITD